MTTLSDSINLQRVIDATISHRDLDQFSRAVWEVLSEYVAEADDFGIARYRPERQQFEVIAARIDGSHNDSNVGTKTKDTPDSPGGFLMQRGQTVMINDFDAFEAQSGHKMRELFKRGFESGIGALLERNGEVLGYIYVSSRKKGVFTEEHRLFMDSIRGVLALALENTLAFNQLDALRQRAEMETDYLRTEIGEKFPNDGVVGSSEQWRGILHHINHVAKTDSTVLIQGETGTGKEVIARAIHERSRRANKPLIKINCGALPENLVESELFGHEKGAFTGALGKRIGRFELANGGTIFLDEIGEMPLSLQVKLLRVLQEREFERVGGEKPIRVNVRVIAATNKKLHEEMEKGNFRSDLFYRLNVFPVQIPALRERPDDAVELARYFAKKLSAEMGRGPIRLREEGLEAVRNYNWPGNVRELQHLVERALILTNSADVDLRPFITPAGAAITVALPKATEVVRDLEQGNPVSLKKTFEEAERAAIMTALRDCNGVVGGRNGAAARLGLKRQTLQSKMKKLGITLGQPQRDLNAQEDKPAVIPMVPERRSTAASQSNGVGV